MSGLLGASNGDNANELPAPAVAHEISAPTTHHERLAPRGREVAQVRGVQAERVVVSTQLDPFLALRALASYSGLSFGSFVTSSSSPSTRCPAIAWAGRSWSASRSSMTG